MKRIDAPGERFQAGDPTVRRPGTIVPAWWLNQLQEELASVIAAAGLELDGTRSDQLCGAIIHLAGNAYSAATREAAGLVRLATDEEVEAGTGNGVITAASLLRRAATVDRSGLVRLATEAEARAGESATLAISAAVLARILEGLESNQWMGVPVGCYITPITPPPVDDPRYRYVLCTAGQSGAGGYNEGILTSESVSGSAPLLEATATVSLAGSPLDGLPIHLINTEGRFVAPGVTQTFENDQMQLIRGSTGWRTVPFASEEKIYSDGPTIETATNAASGYFAEAIFDSSRVARTGTHTQPRAHRLPHYRRIL